MYTSTAMSSKKNPIAGLIMAMSRNFNGKMAASFTLIRPENALTKTFINANCMDIDSATRK